MRIKGEVESIDLKRFSLTPESGLSEKELEELSRAITLKYDADYYNKKNAEEFNQKLDLFNSFITDVNMKAIAMGEAGVDLGVDMVIGAYKLGIEPVARLGDLFVAWNLKNLGRMPQEAFDNKYNDYCTYAENLTSGLGGALTNVFNINLEENTLLSPIYYTFTGFGEYIKGNMTHGETVEYFKRVIESILIVEGGVKALEKGYTIVKNKLATTSTTGVVEGLNQVDDIIKTSDDIRYEKYWENLAKRTDDIPPNWTPDEYQKYINATERVDAELALKKIDADELIEARKKALNEGGVNTVKGGLNTKVHPSKQPNIAAEPVGSRTKINYSDPDLDNIRALTRENEAADTLAKQGYVVEQNPKVPGNKNPDYLIEGEIFDCYSPQKGTSVRNIASGISNKVETGQTNRIILNLDDWHGNGGNLDDLVTQLNEWPIEGLEEVKIINQYHEVINIYP
ncbi:CdiA C-terminal domain-containing protein [Cellulosilyticum lentocellum]|uniref:tRNA nuclease CdiA C-terminal domain-containing protein n=1 Tax=Cellulosilyticum lentocellum (strain ATCC 49066 / DSM 5427 / NCIMB 11756 / RHM5) TaxID=642492 RepID=F2JKJ9_CELLD|nr:hypothetical protein [Cellulosilyticum lentocellum]ADZ82159.1 hypothetical protein Clole_0416 [Cellulosilyticum lentocellum DSM 5427]